MQAYNLEHGLVKARTWSDCSTLQGHHARAQPPAWVVQGAAFKPKFGGVGAGDVQRLIGGGGDNGASAGLANTCWAESSLHRKTLEHVCDSVLT